MGKEYVEQRGGGYYLLGSRVSLDSVAYAFLRGASPETIAQSFPTLTLEQVYGAITFYLANQPEVDDYLARGEAEFAELRNAWRTANPTLFRKLEEARQQLQTSRR